MISSNKVKTTTPEHLALKEALWRIEEINLALLRVTELLEYLTSAKQVKGGDSGNLRNRQTQMGLILKTKGKML